MVDSVFRAHFAVISAAPYSSGTAAVDFASCSEAVLDSAFPLVLVEAVDQGVAMLSSGVGDVRSLAD